MNGKFDFSKLDKKALTYIGIGAAVVVLVVVVILVAVLGGKPSSAQGSSETQHTQNSYTKDTEGTETQSSQEMSSDITDTGSDSATEIETATDTAIANPSETGSENTDSADSQNPSQSTGPTQDTKPSQSTETPEPSETEKPSEEPTETEPAEGSKENPLSVYPDGEEGAYYISVPEIAAGETLYLNAYRLGERKLVIEDSDARVVYDGKTYKAKNGKVTVEISYELADKAIPLEIKNNGKKAKTFAVKIETIEGTYDAPKKLDSMNGKNNSVSFEGENLHEYYYTYTAEKTGTIRFTVASSTNDAKIDICVTNTGVNYDKTIQDSIYEESGEQEWLTYLEVDVEKGDVLQIVVSTKVDSNWEYPDSNVKWNGSYK